MADPLRRRTNLTPVSQKIYTARRPGAPGAGRSVGGPPDRSATRLAVRDDVPRPARARSGAAARPTPCSGCTGPTWSACPTRRPGSTSAMAGRVDVDDAVDAGSRTRQRGATASDLNGAFSEPSASRSATTSCATSARVHGPDGPAEDEMANHLVLTVHGLPTDENPAGTGTSTPGSATRSTSRCR